jgi:hypothetical protein
LQKKYRKKNKFTRKGLNEIEAGVLGEFKMNNWGDWRAEEVADDWPKNGEWN